MYFLALLTSFSRVDRSSWVFGSSKTWMEEHIKCLGKKNGSFINPTITLNNYDYSPTYFRTSRHLFGSPTPLLRCPNKIYYPQWIHPSSTGPSRQASWELLRPIYRALCLSVVGSEGQFPALPRLPGRPRRCCGPRARPHLPRPPKSVVSASSSRRLTTSTTLGWSASLRRRGLLWKIDSQGSLPLCSRRIRTILISKGLRMFLGLGRRTIRVSRRRF